MDNLIVIDTETTGLKPGHDEILQLSIIDGDENVLFNEYIKPIRRKRWPKAQEINGIAPKMVKDCKTLDELHDQIQGILDSADFIVAYNWSFDRQMLVAAGFKVRQPYYDVMKEFAPIYGEYDSYHDDYTWKSLSVCADYFSYEFKAHDSLEDTKATLFCYKKMQALKENNKREKQEQRVRAAQERKARKEEEQRQKQALQMLSEDDLKRMKYDKQSQHIGRYQALFVVMIILAAMFLLAFAGDHNPAYLVLGLIFSGLAVLARRKVLALRRYKQTGKIGR